MQTAPQPFTSVWRGISPILSITWLLRILPVAHAGANIGWMSNRSCNSRESRGPWVRFVISRDGGRPWVRFVISRDGRRPWVRFVISSDGRSPWVGFVISCIVLRLQRLVYEISEIGLKAMKMRFVARAASTFCPAATAIRLEAQGRNQNVTIFLGEQSTPTLSKSPRRFRRNAAA